MTEQDTKMAAGLEKRLGTLMAYHTALNWANAAGHDGDERAVEQYHAVATLLSRWADSRVVRPPCVDERVSTAPLVGEADC